MKKYVVVIGCIIAVVGIGLFIGSRDNTVLPPQSDNKASDSITPTKVVLSDTDTTSTVVSDEPNIEESDIEEITDKTNTSKKMESFDWRTDDMPRAKQMADDPFSAELAIQKAKEEGTWMENPETMSREEFRKVIYKQRLKRFGDIPQLHTAMEYQRKLDENIPMTLDERIEGMKAHVYLYPYETNKRTLTVLEWMRSKGPKLESITKITPADIKHLRSLGVTIETEGGDGEDIVKMSTK